jgi:hypothetical protein
MEHPRGPSAVVALTTGSPSTRPSEPGVAPAPTPPDDAALARAAAPVQEHPTPRDETDALDAPKPGIALCLSGGGYWAMLFHVGALWRLNETGYLQQLDRVSSVSGGSITAALLGWRWHALTFADGVATNFDAEITQRLRRFASRSIDWQAMPYESTIKLAAVPTRLKGMDATLQERLINWGYAVWDAALRRHVDATMPAPGVFPYPHAGVGERTEVAGGA